tara:strand:+ start:1457 stop:1906 length:450 start_codon:yes stop_codon:yes gene_type:complete
MEINSLHINETDFDVFLELDPKDKIEFIYDAQFQGKDISLHKALSKLNVQPKSIKPKQATLNNLFQDTMPDTIYDELQWDEQRLNLMVANNMIHLNSTSIKWIRRIVKKLFNDGHIIIRNKFAKKTSIDLYRYYRCYDLIGSGIPICLN